MIPQAEEHPFFCDCLECLSPGEKASPVKSRAPVNETMPAEKQGTVFASEFSLAIPGRGICGS